MLSTTPFTIPVVGVSYYPENVAKIKEGDAVVFVREPSNKHDPNAVAVLSAENLALLGYIPRALTKKFPLEQSNLDHTSGEVVQALHKPDDTGDEPVTVGLRVRVQHNVNECES